MRSVVALMPIPTLRRSRARGYRPGASWFLLAAFSAALAFASVASGQPPYGRGGPGRHHGDPAHRQDHEVFFFLLENRDRIVRTVTKLPDGVETLTESSDPAVAAKLREHVAAMTARLREHRPIHLRDPLFAEIFRHADQITVEEERTDKGLRVKETSRDPYVAELIQAHADVVSAFLENGHAEMRRDHRVPPPPAAP